MATGAAALTKFPPALVEQLEKILPMVEGWIKAQDQKDGNKADDIFKKTEQFCLSIDKPELSKDDRYQIFDMAMSSAAIAVVKKLRTQLKDQDTHVHKFLQDFDKAKSPTPTHIEEKLWRDWQKKFHANADKCTNEVLARKNVGKTREISSKADVKALPAAHKEELKKKMLTQNVIMISGCQDTSSA
jgi:hypothetical protein